MHRVLLAVDGDEERLASQLKAIRNLPGRDDLSVLVLFVHEEVDAPPDEAGSSVIESINEGIDRLQGVPDAITEAKETLEALDIPVEVLTGKGDVSTVILDTAADRDVDSLCLASHKRTAVGKAVFGSVTQKVVLESDRPVLVV
ncbi:universal stress protein [Haloarcula sp. JP-L23]|uniref:universal stress protein n=1 Tax=Haloarcula sp. JP-L23 TaxID=2716717 RepID=UPI00140EEFEA|nr:universal stress protein [Haloarcula sp. JP-L23]